MLKTEIALIPAYEPNQLLVGLAERLFKTGFSVVVVDDGSGPDYTDVFRQAEVYAKVISYTPNCGKGCALKAGLDYIAARCDKKSVIVTLDCDGQHTVEDAVRVASCALAHPDALTLGVRTLGTGTPVRSRFGNSVTRTVYRLSTGLHVSDTQTGLRAFGVVLLPQMAAIEGKRYEYEMNVLMECPRRRIPIREVPIQTIYLEGNRASHFHPLRDSFLIYGNIIKFAASSLTGFAIDYSLYSLLTVLLGPLGAAAIPISNVAARVVSAGVNFTINKKFVFKNRDSVWKTGAQYFVLAACILTGNTVLLSFLVNTLGANRFAAKLVTEVTFFTLSWLAQRFWIFRKKAARTEKITTRGTHRLPGRME